MNMSEQNYLLNIDAIQGLSNMPDECVDLVLTDPPYGIANKTKLTKVGNKIVNTQKAWGNDFQDSWPDVESYYDWLKPFIAQMVRVMKDNGTMLLFLDRTYTGFIVRMLERDFGLNYRNKIYFVKTNPLPHFQKNGYRSAVEECLFLTKSNQYQFNFGEQKDMVQVYQGSIGHGKTKIDGVSHPTEKYKWMVEPLLLNHSNPGDVVLDAFAGSGSVIVHARKHQRKAIGFEKNPTFYNLAKARCQQEQLEMNFE